MDSLAFQILPTQLLNAFDLRIDFDPSEYLNAIQKIELPVDYFEFYRSVSSVYSSRIEGENIDFDSFFKHRFLKVSYNPDYTKRADDLYTAYEFTERKKLTFENLKKAHSILSESLLPPTERGALRTNPMFVINNEEGIEYVAATPDVIKEELEKLFSDTHQLLEAELTPTETFFFAALIHLVFVKIHPFQDGNGRAARLLEKWFLTEKLGTTASSIQLEKNYFTHSADYYLNLQKLGLEYETLNYDRALDFLLMTINGLKMRSECSNL